MSRTKHDFPDRFFAVVRDKDNDKDIVYGVKGKKVHNHIRLKIDGVPLFHRVRDEDAGIKWTDTSVTHIGNPLEVSFL